MKNIKIRYILLITCLTVAVVIGLPLMDAVRRSADTSERGHRVLFALDALRFWGESENLPKWAHSSANGDLTVSWRYDVYLANRGYGHGIPSRLSQPWDSPENQKFSANFPPEFCTRDSTEAQIFSVVGPGTPFDPQRNVTIGDLDVDTILLIEVRDSKLHWMEPGDFQLEDMADGNPKDLGFGSTMGTQDGFFVGFADREVWLLSNETPMSKLLPFMTVEGAKDRDRSEDLAEFKLR